MDIRKFADNVFIHSFFAKEQTISECVVNAQLQSRISVNSIRDLQEQAEYQILHYKSRWISAIEMNLWPYVLQNSN